MKYIKKKKKTDKKSQTINLFASNLSHGICIKYIVIMKSHHIPIHPV